MIPINRTYAPLQAFVDELARCGIRHAVTCPGSRNAPLVLTLAAQPEIEAVSVVDERSAGFVALGLAKASRHPVAITVTSGTAGANLLPAVVEAWEAHVPLIVLTADRPPELRDVGAGQAIDQIKLYGAFAKWFTEVGNHEPGRATAVHYRSLACRAWATALGGRPGPVHLNFPLREPLAPVREEGLIADEWAGRPGERPWVEVWAPSAREQDVAAALAEELGDSPRGVVVCGGTAERVAEPAARLAAATGWPLLADATSGVRCGGHDRSHVIAHYDVLLRHEGWAAAQRPQVAIRFGATPTSKPLRAWLARTRQVVLDPHGGWDEPTRMAPTVVQAPAAAVCEALAGRMAGGARDERWLGSWRAADALVPAALAEMPDPFEPKAIAALADAEPGTLVWVSSSMPIRDVESYFPSVATDLRFLANRGANGIDGVTSSALGAAIATGAPTIVVTGELALLHDLGGLAAARRAGAQLGVLCLNNGGGGIFDFLPVAEHAEAELYEEHIATPAAVDLRAAAALGGLEYGGERPAPGRLVELRTDRRENVRLHRELIARIGAKLGAA